MEGRKDKVIAENIFKGAFERQEGGREGGRRRECRGMGRRLSRCSCMICTPLSDRPSVRRLRSEIEIILGAVAAPEHTRPVSVPFSLHKILGNNHGPTNTPTLFGYWLDHA